MGTVQAEDIDDIVAGTLRDLGAPKFSQVAQELQRYPVMKEWLQKDRVVFDDGYGIQRTIADETIGAASHLGLFEEDDVDVGDHLVNMTVNWIHAQTKWGYDVREKSMNAGSSKIVDVVEVRRDMAILDLAQIFEERAWQVPSTTDTINPFGLPYWVVYNATDGFTGATPGSHTTVGGINPTTHPNWKSYNATYVNFTDDDALDLMRTAHRKIGFISPLDRREYYNFGKRYRIYIDNDTMNAVDRISRANNESLGIDLDAVGAGSRPGRMRGSMSISTIDEAPVFKRIAFVWVPYLDDNMVAGSNPLYMIDNEAFRTGILKGHYMRKTGPQQSPKQHNVRECFYDTSYQYFCVNRRACALIAKSDPIA